MCLTRARYLIRRNNQLSPLVHKVFKRKHNFIERHSNALTVRFGGHCPDGPEILLFKWTFDYHLSSVACHPLEGPALGYLCCFKPHSLSNGHNTCAGYPLSDLYVFNTTASVWTDLSAVSSGSEPQARYNHGFTSEGDRLYVHGGENEDYNGKIMKMWKCDNWMYIFLELRNFCEPWENFDQIFFVDPGPPKNTQIYKTSHLIWKLQTLGSRPRNAELSSSAEACWKSLCHLEADWEKKSGSGYGVPMRFKSIACRYLLDDVGWLCRVR